MIEFLRQTENYQALVSRLKDGKKLPWLRGLVNASTAYLLTALIDDFPKRPFLIVLPSQREAEQILEEIWTYRAYPALESSPTPDAYPELNLFPGWHRKFVEGVAPPKNIVADRMRCLERLLHGERSIVVTTSQALLYKLPSRTCLAAACRVVNLGDEIDPDDIAGMLMDGGYQNVELVEVKGEFARRGDILDVFPLTGATPVRLEFFGDEVDAIRAFDPISQRSTEALESVTLTPLREIFAADLSMDYWQAQTNAFIQERATPQIINTIREITRDLTESESSPHGLAACTQNSRLDAFLPLLTPEVELLTDYLSADTIVCLIEPQWQKREAARLHEQMQEIYQQKLDESHFVVPPDKLLVPFETLTTQIEQYPVVSASVAPPREIADNELVPMPFGMEPLALPAGNYQTVINQIKTWAQQGKRVHLFCETPQQAKRVSEILAERDVLPPRYRH